jgi:hypothetical protein
VTIHPLIRKTLISEEKEEEEEEEEELEKELRKKRCEN